MLACHGIDPGEMKKLDDIEDVENCWSDEEGEVECTGADFRQKHEYFI